MSGPFKLKYKNSAFPFKSPLRDHEKDEDGNVIEHETELIGINPSDTTTINRMRKAMSEKREGGSGVGGMRKALEEEFPE